jgi:hypothetical protein
MTFCTIVEFGWDETFDHAGFAEMIGKTGDSGILASAPLPAPARVSGFEVTSCSAA